jgi:hypothetical protein
LSQAAARRLIRWPVLLFTNVTADPSSEYLSDETTESLYQQPFT